METTTIKPVPFTEKISGITSLLFQEKNTRLVFRGYELKFNGQWSSEPVIEDVQRAPSVEDVKKLADERRKLEKIQEPS